MSWLSSLPIRRIEEHPLEPMGRDRWPATVAPVRQVLDEGLELGPATVLAALPAATLYELGPWGVRPCTYDDLELVRNWRLFLDAPERLLRHLD
ncbi:hypothetical protein [Citricoccus sp.]|uniref:hypothetical protein n=1 Tax=Citricoccus sp. TaxID=1978372 RepID=UPI0028BDEF70|nr:hypothetical protein [Citricoccus sp.]